MTLKQQDSLYGLIQQARELYTLKEEKDELREWCKINGAYANYW